MKAVYSFLLVFITVFSTVSFGQEEQQSAQTEQKLSATSKYDFMPGESLMFFDDFTQDNIGDFPATWNTNGSGEIVITNLFAGRWFKLVGPAMFIPETKKIFPDNFTVEFDVLPILGEADANTMEMGFYVYAAENPSDLNEGGALPGVTGIKMNFGMYQHGFDAYTSGEYTINGVTEKSPLVINQKTRMSFWIQKTRLRAYINDVKVFDLPRGLPAGFKYNVLRFEIHDGAIPLIANFRVAVGAPDMRNKLITEGKLVTYGIYFDSGSDKIKPESAGTMKELANVLTENPTVRVKIIGHTDSDGDDAKNLDLSKRRSISVKNAFSSEYGIDASRIETDGMGETQPIAPNATSDGKAKNRRVELIKL
jgi:flagellar motor protein MotB